MLIEKIGYFDFTGEELSTPHPDLKPILKRKLLYERRDSVEKGRYLQPIPIAVITNKERNKVLVVRKTPKGLSSDSP
ncbi:MAG: hypothetical protein IPF41_17240, partial [Flavobacteriales bacterium]|nr:hypothetical protein [Flavobacteriales bacterium]